MVCEVLGNARSNSPRMHMGIETCGRTVGVHWIGAGTPFNNSGGLLRQQSVGCRTGRNLSELINDPGRASDLAQ